MSETVTIQSGENKIEITKHALLSIVCGCESIEYEYGPDQDMLEECDKIRKVIGRER